MCSVRYAFWQLQQFHVNLSCYFKFTNNKHANKFVFLQSNNTDIDDGLSCRFRQISFVALTVTRQPNTRSAYATIDVINVLGALMTACFSGLSFEY